MMAARVMLKTVPRNTSSFVLGVFSLIGGGCCANCSWGRPKKIAAASAICASRQAAESLFCVLIEADLERTQKLHVLGGDSIAPPLAGFGVGIYGRLTFIVETNVKALEEAFILAGDDEGGIFGALAQANGGVEDQENVVAGRADGTDYISDLVRIGHRFVDGLTQFAEKLPQAIIEPQVSPPPVASHQATFYVPTSRSVKEPGVPILGASYRQWVNGLSR